MTASASPWKAAPSSTSPNSFRAVLTLRVYLPLKPEGTRWATYEKWVAKYDVFEDALDAHFALSLARGLKRI